MWIRKWKLSSFCQFGGQTLLEDKSRENLLLLVNFFRIVYESFTSSVEFGRIARRSKRGDPIGRFRGATRGQGSSLSFRFVGSSFERKKKKRNGNAKVRRDDEPSNDVGPRRTNSPRDRFANALTRETYWTVGGRETRDENRTGEEERP